MTILCAHQYGMDVSTETVHAGTTGDPCQIQKLTRKLALKLGSNPQWLTGLVAGAAALLDTLHSSSIFVSQFACDLSVCHCGFTTELSLSVHEVPVLLCDWT